MIDLPKVIVYLSGKDTRKEIDFRDKQEDVYPEETLSGCYCNDLPLTGPST